MSIRYSKNPDIVFRKIAGETLLVPVRGAIHDLESIYALNETATRVWELLDGARTTDEISAAIAEEFEVSSADAREDVEDFLRSVAGINVVREAK